MHTRALASTAASSINTPPPPKPTNTTTDNNNNDKAIKNAGGRAQTKPRYNTHNAPPEAISAGGRTRKKASYSAAPSKKVRTRNCRPSLTRRRRSQGWSFDPRGVASRRRAKVR